MQYIVTIKKHDQSENLLFSSWRNAKLFIKLHGNDYDDAYIRVIA